MLKAIDKAWAGKKIIWEKIDEEKLMTYDQILESFPDKVAVKKAVVAVVDDPNKPKQILDSKSSDSLSVILMRLPKSK
jgi:3-hydroxyacyl-CoA dehydrogenase